MATVQSDKAFPTYSWVDSSGTHHPGSTGLTKREYFAALAMQGLLAMQSQDWHGDGPEDVAEGAVEHADALIAALNGEGQANG